MKKQKGISLIGIVIALLIIAIAGFGGWRLYNNLTADNVNDSNNQNPKSSVITWTNYQDAKHGIGFTYPKNWGDSVQIDEKAAEVGKQYSVTFIQKGDNNSNKAIAFAISMDSNDLKATFCKSASNCVTSGGITKASVEQGLKDGSGIVQKDSTSYTTLVNVPEQKISGMTIYQIVELTKINVSAVVLSYQKVGSGVNCPSDKLASSSMSSCMNKSDYEILNKIAKSIHSI